VGAAEAAVALVLRPRSALELLVVKRAERRSDPWSGHMALPGGRKDAGDSSLLHTARRETWEEVGLSLERTGKLLGRLEVVAPMSRHLPPLAVLPLVFAVPGGAGARVASPEVAEVHWTSLRHLRGADARKTHLFTRDDRPLAFPAFDVGGRTVWGLTHRILEDFLSRVT
jgi:8-oxo-dGTP pyrophosphatase MutT (NUDIX family)